MRVLWVVLLVACSGVDVVGADAGTDAGPVDAGNGGLVEPREFCEFMRASGCERFHRCWPRKDLIRPEDQAQYGLSITECLTIQAGIQTCSDPELGPNGCAPPDDVYSRYFRCYSWYGAESACNDAVQPESCDLKSCP